MQAYRLPEAFRIGYGCLDEDHTELVGLLNALREPGGADGLVQDGGAFVAALRAHFEREEQLMTQLGYPRLAEHRTHHRECLAAIAAILQPFAIPDLTKEAVDQLFGVLVDAIVRVDLYFEEFLIGTGRLQGGTKAV